MDIFEEYITKFGVRPPVLLFDEPALVEEAIRQALKTGIPWVREESEQEGVVE